LPPGSFTFAAVQVLPATSVAPVDVVHRIRGVPVAVRVAPLGAPSVMVTVSPATVAVEPVKDTVEVT
jgi:hypothetical protein